MRIVSQDGVVDMPYEQVGLSLHSYGGIGRYEIMANERQNGSKIARMGTYSDKDLALKVMKVLRDSYVLGWKVFEFPKDGSDLMKKTMRRILSVILVILLIVTASITLTGCGTQANKIAADSEHTEELEVWALIKVNGGEPLHVKVVKWNFIGYGSIRIYTEDRAYLTGVENVLLMADLN